MTSPPQYALTYKKMIRYFLEQYLEEGQYTPHEYETLISQINELNDDTLEKRYIDQLLIANELDLDSTQCQKLITKDINKILEELLA